MKIFIKKNDIAMILGASLSLFLVGLLINFNSDVASGLLFFIGLSVILVILVQFELYRRSSKGLSFLSKNINQTMAFQQIIAAIKPIKFLPSMRGWAISPDIGYMYVDKIFEKKPNVIVECGSGVSTILAAYCLKQIGSGKVIALDHEQEFASKTKDQIKEHGLEDFAEVVYAPITKQNFGGEEYLWYDAVKIPSLSEVNILLVDGPPAHLQKMSRYPALLKFSKLMKRDVMIIIDDADRVDERAMVKRWVGEFSLTEERFTAEKGGVILRKKK